MSISQRIDTDTKNWILDASDERAARAGMVMDLEAAASVIDWIEANCRLYEGETAGQPLELLGWQKSFIVRLFGWRMWDPEWGQWVRRFRKASLWAAKKNGKPVAVDTPVPTTVGMVPMGELTTDHVVFDERGKPTKIVATSEVMHGRKCYRIRFGGGVEVVAADDHLWAVEVKSRLRDETRNKWVCAILTTKEIADRTSRASRHDIRIVVPPQTETQDIILPVDPYWLGFWLGNGKRDKARGDITIRMCDIDQVLPKLIAGEGEPTSNWDNPGESRHYYFTGMADRLTSLGLRSVKTIPEPYLQAGTSQRWELLRGLMDSDGCISGNRNQCIYSTSDPDLRDTVIRLLSSLGFKATFSTVSPSKSNGQTKDNYRVTFTGQRGQPLSTLDRKLKNLVELKPDQRSSRRTVISCEPCPSVPVRCIQVEAESSLFLLTDRYIPTHNSPFLAALGLNLLINDGEKGQKVYTAAKTGDQARISQLHAAEMVRMSPYLDANCKINASTLEIKHLKSKSRMIVLAGNDSRGQKSKEGLNGSVLFDEMHVVDRGLEERVSRAGISRKQPLQLSASTSGDDVSSIGKERFDYGRQVARGDRDDLRFLHVEYCVPDKVTEADIVRDPDKYGPMANPSWGVIVKPSEFKADLMNSRGKPREMARFMQYRGNLWVGSTNRWLDIQKWEECAAPEIRIEHLAGRECYLGLDMARRLDMASAVFAFPWPEAGDDGVFFWPMFWLPEDTAKARDIMYPFMTWSRDGELKVTPGATTDYDRIKKDLRDFVSQSGCNLLNIFYDEHYANETTQRLVEGETDGAGRTIVPGWGCPRTAYPQTITYFTGDATELERRIRKKSVRHTNNAVMNWQIGHVEVKTDANQNIRPVKPDPNSGKAIDGVVAAVMALQGVIAAVRDVPQVWG